LQRLINRDDIFVTVRQLGVWGSSKSDRKQKRTVEAAR